LKNSLFDRPLPPWLARLLVRFPSLRRHPHPALAHFPIVFFLSTTGFSLLYLLTGSRSFEHTAFHCLAGGVVSTPAAILTGLFTLRLNYPGEPGRDIILEERLSWLLLAVAVAALVWRLVNPAVLEDLAGVNIIYLLLVLSLTPLVTVISFFGGMLTFPLEEDAEERQEQ
jgi:uncharacterized membrane protein